MIVEKLTKHVAQWIEHQIPILKVGGSIPFMLIVFFNSNSENNIFCKKKLGADLVSTFKSYLYKPGQSLYSL